VSSGLGIDIYRYQTVTNWRTVKDAMLRISPDRAPQPIEWVYVKLTDGTGTAVARGDGQVNGAKSVGLPVGGYHFAQPGDPVRQANVFLDEATRLDALDLPPMLDLEDEPTGTNIPNSQKRDFATKFCQVIRGAGFRPALYMSSADAANLRPDTWGIPGLVVWIASYGRNNGYRNALTGGYLGRVDIHQYTSMGSVPGISGAVDLNESMINLQEDGVSAQDVKDALNDPNWRVIQGPDNVARTVVEDAAQKGVWLSQIMVLLRGLNDELNESEVAVLGAVREGNANILAKIAAIPPGGTPTDEQMDALVDALESTLPAATAAEVGRRLLGVSPAQ